MGWWKEEKGNSELLIGDEPVDIAGEMVDRVANAYMEDAKRRPTPLELARTLEIALLARVETLLEGCEELEVHSITVKLKKRPKMRKITSGDYFAVPLPSGGYGFGRANRVFMRTIVIGEFLAVRSDSPLSVDELCKMPVLFEALFIGKGLAERRWPILGNVPVPGSEFSSRLVEKKELEEESLRLQHGYGSTVVAKKLDDELQRRFPRR